MTKLVAGACHPRFLMHAMFVCCHFDDPAALASANVFVASLIDKKILS